MRLFGGALAAAAAVGVVALSNNIGVLDIDPEYMASKVRTKPIEHGTSIKDADELGAMDEEEYEYLDEEEPASDSDDDEDKLLAGVETLGTFLERRENAAMAINFPSGRAAGCDVTDRHFLRPLPSIFLRQ